MEKWIHAASYHIETWSKPSVQVLILAEILKSASEKNTIYSKDFSKEMPSKLNISDSLFRKGVKFLLDNEIILRRGAVLYFNNKPNGK